jgi:hypothetical protein
MLENLTLEQTVWVMNANKPLDITVSKITIEKEITFHDGIVTKTTAYASFGKSIQHEFRLIEGQFFATKEDLIKSL